MTGAEDLGVQAPALVAAGHTCQVLLPVGEPRVDALGVGVGVVPGHGLVEHGRALGPGVDDLVALGEGAQHPAEEAEGRLGLLVVDAAAGAAKLNVGQLREGREGPLGVEALGAAEELVDVAGLNDGAVLHDEDLVGEVVDDAEVVADEDDGGAGAGAELDEQVEDLRLDGDVEGAHGLVGDDDLGLGDQGAGDDDPLPLAAGQRPGADVEAVQGQVDELGGVADPLLRLGARGPLAVAAEERPGDALADGVAQVEEADRVPADDLDAVAARAATAVRQWGPGLAVEVLLEHLGEVGAHGPAEREGRQDQGADSLVADDGEPAHLEGEDGEEEAEPEAGDGQDGELDAADDGADEAVLAGEAQGQAQGDDDGDEEGGPRELEGRADLALADVEDPLVLRVGGT